MNSSFLRVLAVSTAAVAALGAGQAPPSKVDLGLYRQMLDDARRDIEKNYYDPKLRDVDLAAIVEAARSKVEAATSTTEAIDAISGVFDAFQDSHTRFFPSVDR